VLERPLNKPKEEGRMDMFGIEIGPYGMIYQHQRDSKGGKLRLIGFADLQNWKEYDWKWRRYV
jgi:hypothetical protein